MVSFFTSFREVINVLDRMGNTPLHYATQMWSQSVVRMLLERGANIGMKVGAESRHLLSRNLILTLLIRTFTTRRPWKTYFPRPWRPSWTNSASPHRETSPTRTSRLVSKTCLGWLGKTDLKCSNVMNISMQKMVGWLRTTRKGISKLIVANLSILLYVNEYKRYISRKGTRLYDTDEERNNWQDPGIPGSEEQWSK